MALNSAAGGLGARLETALVLPSGMIHLPGAVFTGSASAAEALITVWERGQQGARSLGEPLTVAVALPDGTVDSRVFRPGQEPSPVERPPHVPTPDPRWDHEVPDRSGLRTAADAAGRAGDHSAAVAAAGQLAEALRGDLGFHPFTVLALQLHARYLHGAGRWGQASLASLTVAVGLHMLGAPARAEADTLQQAVTAWHRGLGEPGSAQAGFDLAHLILQTCPAPRKLLAGLLLTLDTHLADRFVALGTDAASGRPTLVCRAPTDGTGAGREPGAG